MIEARPGIKYRNIEFEVHNHSSSGWMSRDKKRPQDAGAFSVHRSFSYVSSKMSKCCGLVKKEYIISSNLEGEVNSYHGNNLSQKKSNISLGRVYRSCIQTWATLKRKCCHFDEILITDCTESCHFDNFRCSQWLKFRQNDDISVSVHV